MTLPWAHGCSARGALEVTRVATYLKLGQLLSSRPDLLPDVYIEELGKLVDEVPPFPFAEVERVVREDLGEDALARLEPEPLAAASIAQIHAGLTLSGVIGLYMIWRIIRTPGEL
jgi:predicted unusual protein kinase regulating ubiquinone biosynthesis (AarF/ABC1/UbiB family)